VDNFGTFSAQVRLLAPAKRQFRPPKNQGSGSCFFSATSKNLSGPIPGLPDSARSSLFCYPVASAKTSIRHHAPEQPPRQMVLGRHRPVVPGVLHQPAPVFTCRCREMVSDQFPIFYQQPPPQIPQIVGYLRRIVRSARWSHCT